MTEEEKLAEEYRKELKERLLRDDDFERLEMFDENVEEAYLAGRKSNSEVIADLKKKNAELKDKLKNLASVAEVRLANWQKYEKENKELKKRNGELAGEKASLERWFGEAKEIIRDLLSLKSTASTAEDVKKRFSVRERAEQFIKEGEDD